MSPATDPVSTTADLAMHYLDKGEKAAAAADWYQMIDAARGLREQAVALEHYAHLQLRKDRRAA